MRLGMGLGLGNLLSGQPLTGFPNDFSFNFDGSNDYLDIGSVSLTGQFTVSFYCNINTSSQTEFVIGSTGSNKIGFLGGDVFVRAINGGSSDTSVSEPSSGSFHHIVVTRDSSNKVDLYLNGGSANRLFSDSAQSGTVTWNYVGRDSTTTQNFTGLIDEVAIWDTALSASDVAKIASKPVDFSKASTYATDRTANLKLWLRAGDKVLPESDASIARSDFYTDFDGTDDYVDAGTTMGTALGDNYAGSLTTCFWFKADVTSGDDGLFNIGNFSNTEGEWSISIVGNKLRFKLNAGGWKIELNPFTSTDWNHLACVYSAGSESNSKMYLNGESVGTASGTFPSASDIDLNGLKTILGGYYSSSYPLDGAISNVSIHQTALDAQTISQMAKSRFTPMRDNRFSAVSFDGGDEYINIADSDALSFGDGSSDSPFSISAWINPIDSTQFQILGKLSEWQLYLGSDDKLILFLEGENSSTYEYASDSGSAISENVWTHVVCTYNGVGGTSANAGIKLYVNGVESSYSLGGDGLYNAMQNTTNPVRIGNYGGQYAEGNISSVALYSDLKDSDFIYAQYQKGITHNPSADTGLIGLWRMGDDTSKAYPTIADSSSNSNDGTMTAGQSTDIVQQMVAGYDMGAFESSSEELNGNSFENESFETWDDADTINWWTHKDVNNNSGSGLISQVGSGETTGGSGTGSVNFFASTASNMSLTTPQNILKNNTLYKFVADVSRFEAGQLRLTLATNATVNLTSADVVNNQIVYYFVSGGSNYHYLRLSGSGVCDFTLDSVSLKEVLQSDLSDTYPAIIDVNEPVLGVELITSNTTSEWNKYSEDGTGDLNDTSNGVALTAGSDTRNSYRFVSGLTDGKLYKLNVDAYYSGSSDTVKIEIIAGSGSLFTPALTTTSTNYTIYFVKNSGTMYILGHGFNNGNVLYVENLTVKEIQGNVGTMTQMEGVSNLVYSSVLPDQSFLTGVNSAYNFIDLDGSDQSINCGGDIDVVGAFAISAWVNPDNFEYQLRSIASQGNSFFGFGDHASRKLLFQGQGSSANNLKSNTDLAHSTWHHIVLTVSGTNAGDGAIYVNGTRDDDGESTVFLTAGDFVIGRMPNASSRYFNGKMGQVAVFNKALSSTDASAIHTLGRHGNLLDSYSDNLVGYWGVSALDASTGISDSISTIYDRSGNSHHGIPDNADAGDLASSPNAEPQGYSKNETNRSNNTP